MGALPEVAVLDELIKRRLDEILPQKLEEKIAEQKGSKTPSMAIIVTGGTLDLGYLPLILSATAAALGWNVSAFFTFYGLQLLKKDISDLKASPLGNPAMPMNLPFGPRWFMDINWNIPNAIQSCVPGFEALATALMKQTFKRNGVATLTELRSLCLDAGVQFVACQMTIDLFGFSHDDFIPEVREYVGAASFLPMAKDADVSMFM